MRGVLQACVLVGKSCEWVDVERDCILEIDSVDEYADEQNCQ
jgi:hypothetical protein